MVLLANIKNTPNLILFTIYVNNTMTYFDACIVLFSCLFIIYLNEKTSKMKTPKLIINKLHTNTKNY